MIWNRGIMFDDTEFDGSYQGGDIFLPGSQPFLHVNANGERFMNEDQCYPHELRRRREPARPLLVDRLGRQLLGRHRAVRHLRLLALFPAPSGTAFNADVYDCEAITKEHLDSFWLEPRIESGALKKQRHARRAGESDEVRRRPNRHVQGHHRTL